MLKLLLLFSSLVIPFGVSHVHDCPPPVRCPPPNYQVLTMDRGRDFFGHECYSKWDCGNSLLACTKTVCSPNEPQCTSGIFTCQFNPGSKAKQYYKKPCHADKDCGSSSFTCALEEDKENSRQNSPTTAGASSSQESPTTAGASSSQESPTAEVPSSSQESPTAEVPSSSQESPTTAGASSSQESPTTAGASSSQESPTTAGASSSQEKKCHFSNQVPQTDYTGKPCDKVEDCVEYYDYYCLNEKCVRPQEGLNCLGEGEKYNGTLPCCPKLFWSNNWNFICTTDFVI